MSYLSVPAVLVTVALSALFGRTTAGQPDEQVGKTWAILVAGSNGWWNYRHQVSNHLSAEHVFRLYRPIILT